MGEQALLPTSTRKVVSGPIPVELRRGHRPCFMNGRTSTNTYLVVATNTSFPDYNALGVRKMSDGKVKLHFWPNANAFRHPELYSLFGLYNRPAGISVSQYQGVEVHLTKLLEVLNKLAGEPEFWVAPVDEIKKVLDQGFVESEHATA